MKRCLKWLDKNFECLIIAILLVFITVFMTMQVITRKLPVSNLSWVEPLCCHFMIYIGLLGIACTLAEGNSIRFDVIAAFVSAKVKTILEIVADIITAITFIYLTPYSIQIVQEMTTKTVAGLPYMKSLVYGVCAFAVIVIDIRSVEQAIKAILRVKRMGKADAEVEEVKEA